MKAIAYVRASTGQQIQTLAAQRDRIERWAEREGIELVSVHVDAGVSGTTPVVKRPALSDALVALERERADLLVVTCRDRLARSALDAALLDREIGKLGARVVCADGGAANADSDEGRLVRTILDAVAEFEAARTRARTRAVLRHRRAQGLRNGGRTPYGYRPSGGRLVAHPQEQRALARARALASDGLSQRAIAQTLESEGHPPRGERWHRTTVARLLARD